MKWHAKVKLVLWRRWISVKSFPHKVKCIIWNQSVLVWWYKSRIPEDEFHSSLEIDPWATSYMSEEELSVYHSDIVRRHAIAHQRDLEKSDEE